MAAKRDYYEILGVSKNASEDELKKAFREAARKHHPDVDKTPGAEERFKEINEAYQVVSNPEKRRAYDQFGHDAFGAGGQAGGNPFAGGGFGPFTYSWGSNGGNVDINDIFGGEGLGDIFDAFFGGGMRKPRKGRDVSLEIQIGFLEAVWGVEKDVGYSGKKIKAKIPAGAFDGLQLRFSGEGEPGQSNTPNGDLYLLVRVMPDSRFSRNGDDLYTLKTISFTTAALGGEITVPSLGDVSSQGIINLQLKIPAGTQFGTDFRIHGKGIPKINGRGRGDLYVRILVEIPKKLSRDEKRILEELASLDRHNN